MGTPPGPPKRPAPSSKKRPAGPPKRPPMGGKRPPPPKRPPGGKRPPPPKRPPGGKRPPPPKRPAGPPKRPPGPPQSGAPKRPAGHPKRPAPPPPAGPPRPVPPPPAEPEQYEEQEFVEEQESFEEQGFDEQEFDEQGYEEEGDFDEEEFDEEEDVEVVAPPSPINPPQEEATGEVSMPAPQQAGVPFETEESNVQEELEPSEQPSMVNESSGLYDNNFASNLNLPPFFISTKFLLFFFVLLLSIGFFAGMSLGVGKPKSTGLKGVVYNPEVPKGRRRCGLPNTGGGCVIYVMNTRPKEIEARELYDLVVYMAGLSENERYLIETANMRYESKIIKPGYIGMFNVIKN